MKKEQLEEALLTLGWTREERSLNNSACQAYYWSHGRDSKPRNDPPDPSNLLVVSQAIEWLREHHGLRAVEAAFHRAADDADTGEILLHAVIDPPQFCLHGVFVGTLCLACEE